MNFNNFQSRERIFKIILSFASPKFYVIYVSKILLEIIENFEIYRGEVGCKEVKDNCLFIRFSVRAFLYNWHTILKNRLSATLGWS